MKKRLNYSDLLQNWMLSYTLSTDVSNQIFDSIWSRIQNAATKTNEKGVKEYGTKLEGLDRGRKE